MSLLLYKCFLAFYYQDFYSLLVLLLVYMNYSREISLHKVDNQI